MHRLSKEILVTLIVPSSSFYFVSTKVLYSGKFSLSLASGDSNTWLYLQIKLISTKFETKSLKYHYFLKKSWTMGWPHKIGGNLCLPHITNYACTASCILCQYYLYLCICLKTRTTLFTFSFSQVLTKCWMKMHLQFILSELTNQRSVCCFSKGISLWLGTKGPFIPAMYMA